MYFKYLRYIARHKWYVFVECCKLGIPWRGFIHDWHKLLPSEFAPYVKHFYGNLPKWDEVNHAMPTYSYRNTKEGNKKRFDFAWLLHQKRGKHHWQWWILREDDGDYKVFPMPDNYRKEMLADWRGAGRAITGKDDTVNWYQANKDKMILHERTREWIEAQLGIEG